MANKRPSYLSIRRRQRNIIEGMGTRYTGSERNKDALAAKEFGVTRAELRKFRDTKPDKLRAIYNRSPAMRKLYAEGERKEVRQTLGLRTVRIYPFREETLTLARRKPKYANEKQIGRVIQRLYYQNNIGPQNWSTYTYENNLPNSITAIRLLWRNGKISNSRYDTILKVWRDNYPGMSDAYFELFYGDLLDAA